MRRFIGSIVTILFISCQSTPQPPKSQDQPQVEYFGKNFKLPDTTYYNEGHHYNKISQDDQFFHNMNMRVIFNDSTIILDRGVYSTIYRGRWGSDWVFYSKHTVIYRRDNLIIRRNNSRLKYWN